MSNSKYSRYKVEQDKFDDLMEIEGYENEDNFLSDYALDSIQPGICINTDCTYTTNVEPDCYEGWCEECSTNTVRSPLALLMMI